MITIPDITQYSLKTMIPKDCIKFLCSNEPPLRNFSPNIRRLNCFQVLKIKMSGGQIRQSVLYIPDQITQQHL